MLVWKVLSWEVSGVVGMCSIGKCLVLTWEVLVLILEVLSAQLGGAWCSVEKCLLLSWEVCGVVGRFSIGRCLFWICLVLSQDVLGTQLRGMGAWLGGAWVFV